MLIFENKDVRVLQHDYIEYFQVQTWGKCDNSRSYGTHYDWCTVLETHSVTEAGRKVKEILQGIKNELSQSC